MAINFHNLHAWFGQLPPPERQLAQPVIHALQAYSRFQDYKRHLQLLASETNDGLRRTSAERLAGFAGRVSALILEELTGLCDEQPGDIIIEAEWSEVDPGPPAGDCPCSPDEEAAQ